MVRGVNRAAHQQWRRRLKRFAGAKLSVAEFCRREAVSVASFYQWRKRLADSHRGETGTTPTFLPLQVSSAASASLQVSFPNGTTLTLSIHEQGLLPNVIAAIAAARTSCGDV